jgi:hypothetical protein
LPERRVMEEENFFVGIQNPAELRRELLEASKRMVEVLKRYENFRDKRAQKKALIEQLRRIMNDLNRMNSKLKQFMPKSNIRVPHEMLAVQPKAAALPAVRSEPKPVTELDRLEMELGEIEGKLSKIGRN